MRINIYTLVDITKTDARRNENQKLFSQQSNFNTVQQTASLRSNLIFRGLEQKTGGIAQYKFGSLFKGKQKYWLVSFDTERDTALITHDMLETDFDFIPVVVGLNESVQIIEPIFRTQDLEHKNIVFEIIDNA